MMSLVTGAVAMVTAFGVQPGGECRRPSRPSRGRFRAHERSRCQRRDCLLSRAPDGQLTKVNRYATGGKGASEDGAVADPLASQGSLTYDADHRLLFAVNGGSNTVTVFAVHHGTRLQRLQTIWSGGVLPTSVSVVGRLVYVLNAGSDGDIAGYRIAPDRRLHPIEHSTRSLGLGNPANANFLKSPSQVEIAPDASAVVVATKTNGVLDVFNLHHDGAPAATAVATTSAGPVPFALNFDAAGRLLVAEASGAETSYRVQHSGSLATVSHVPNGQAATCWSALAKGFVYVSNSGSNTITGYAEDAAGNLSLLDANGVTATTDAAPVDVAASSDGNFLYQEATRAGTIDEFKVNANGSLTRIGTITGLPIDNGSGIEGIAAT